MNLNKNFISKVLKSKVESRRKKYETLRQKLKIPRTKRGNRIYKRIYKKRGKSRGRRLAW